MEKYDLFREFALNVGGLHVQFKFQIPEETWQKMELSEMGRKKVPASMKKDQVSISLPRHMIERLDIITSKRSQFVQSAIESKIKAAEGLKSLSNRRLIAVLLGRYRGDVQKEVILKSWFDEELPESGD